MVRMIPHASYLGAGGRRGGGRTSRGVRVRGDTGGAETDQGGYFWWMVMGMGTSNGTRARSGGGKSCIWCLAGPRGGRSASSGCTLQALEAGLKAAGIPRKRRDGAPCLGPVQAAAAARMGEQSTCPANLTNVRGLGLGLPLAYLVRPLRRVCGGRGGGGGSHWRSQGGRDEC